MQTVRDFTNVDYYELVILAFTNLDYYGTGDLVLCTIKAVNILVKRIHFHVCSFPRSTMRNPIIARR